MPPPRYSATKAEGERRGGGKERVATEVNDKGELVKGMRMLLFDDGERTHAHVPVNLAPPPPSSHPFTALLVR